MYRLRCDESKGPALVAAFFCVSDSVVVAIVVVGGVGSSAVSRRQAVFNFAVIVRHRHHVEGWRRS
jgi:hypothetical protein